MKYLLPWGLIVSRALFAPLVIYLATLTNQWVGTAVVALIWFALIGDILDGIGILLGFTHLWWTGAPQWTLYMMLILANASQLDRFGIAFFLPQWTPDTPSAYHAWRIRQGLPIKKHKLFHGE